MLNDFLKEAMGYIAGKPAEELVNLLKAEEYANEFLIAKKLNLTINQTRNILYKISDYGLVSSTRKKDKKKGWYTYFWRIESLKSLEFLKQLLLKQMDALNQDIKEREMKRFYICERCNIELEESQALLHDFTCNECGDIFKVKDNSKFIRDMKKNVEKFENKLSLINIEISKLQEKAEKTKTRIAKKVEKQTKKIKQEKAANRKLLKQSMPAKSSKKKILKKKSFKKQSKRKK